MKAAVLYEPGGAGNFQLMERPVPLASSGQILVKVKAFGLNRSELMTRKGMSPDVKFPQVLGIECAGEVESDPSGKYKMGQKIFALMGGMGRDYDGSYAEYTVLPAEIVFPFESSLGWDLLGAIPEMYQTVYGSLVLALQIRKGNTLLIRGGTSSIGMLSAQLARDMGLTVIATTRKADKEKLLNENGATHVLIDDGLISEKLRALYPQGVDKVLELIGTTTLKDSLDCASRNGSVCMTGMLAEKWAIPEFTLIGFIPSMVNLTVYDSDIRNITSAAFQEFIGRVEAGSIKLNLSKVFPLDEIIAAHEFMESNQASGKIVVLT